MKLIRLLTAVAAAGLLAGVAYVGQTAVTPADRMAEAAKKLLASLKPEQKSKATFPYDSKERVNWNFVPMQDKNKQPTRKGLALYEMTPEQRDWAIELVKAGTSDNGRQQAFSIMALESILDKLEKGGGSVRDSQWYFVTVFGEPSSTGKWGWRIEGHHLSLNYAIEGGQIASATPFFFGANPAVWMKGQKGELETLYDAENMARALFHMLDDGQKSTAHRKEPFPEPKQGSAFADVGEPVGLAAGDMTDKQKRVLVGLIEAYAHRMPADLAAAELQAVRKAGVDKVHFAYTGGAEPGQPHTYRIQGPTFVIEFLNAQPDAAGNPANHIHSVWRRLDGDFAVKKG